MKDTKLALFMIFSDGSALDAPKMEGNKMGGWGGRYKRNYNLLKHGLDT